MAERVSTIARVTKETRIELDFNIDGTGRDEIATGIAFFDHMMSLFTRHGLFDVKLKAEGDLAVDSHHTVEDVGIVLGQAIADSLGDKIGLYRYGYSLLPMDEALVLVALDLSGRPHLSYDADLLGQMVEGFDTRLVPEFLQALVNTAGLTVHIKLLAGQNSHHMIEAVFKGLGKALDMATKIDPRVGGVPSTKGKL